MSAAFTSALADAPTPSNKTPLRFRHPDYTNEHQDSDLDSDGVSDGEGETTAVDEVGLEDDNYVRKVLAKEKPLPPIKWSNLHKNLQTISTLALTVVPALAIYGAFTTELKWQTAVWAVA